MIDSVVWGFMGAQCLGSLYLYRKSFEGYELSKFWRYVVAGMFVVFSFVIFKYEKNYFNYALLVLGTNFLAAAMIFRGKLRSLIAIAVFFSMSIVFAEMGTVYLVDAMSYYVKLSSSDYLVISLGISRFIVMGVVFYGAKIFAFENDITKNRQFLVMFLSLVMTYGFVSVFFVKSNRELLNISQLLWCSFGVFGILVLSVVCFSVISKMIVLSEEKLRVDMAESRFRVEEEYNNLLMQRYKEAKMIIHDTHKHIKNIEDLKLSKEDEVTKQYKLQLLEVLNNQNGKNLTGNKLVDIILERKEREAKRNNVKVHYDIEPVILNVFSEIDLGTIFNNILDNAIEAAKNSDERSVFLWLYDTNQAFTTIKIVNSYRPKGESRSEGLLDDRGYGIISVKKTVEKIGGNFELSFDEGEKKATTLVMIGYD